MDFNPNLLLHAAPAMVLLSLAELLILKHDDHPKETRKNFTTSIVISFVFLAVTVPLKTVPFMLNSWLYQFRLFELEHTAIWVVGLAIIYDDFTCYWSHRMTHSVRFYWASHLVHHSSETYNFAAGGRQSWVGIYSGSFLLWCWIPLMGISPELMIWVKSVSTIYQFCLHTEIIRKCPGWFEFIFNTPSHHRVHHSRELRNLDMNNGAMLIIWDRIFGTFVPEEKETEYGLCKEIKNPNPVNINFNEFRDMFNDLKKSPKLYHKFMYLFGPPGWSHDGSTKTAKQLRKELVAPKTKLVHIRKMNNDPAEFHRNKRIEVAGVRV
ncbi:MAG TPA: sterol desaturase family protein [Chitinophagaceae bacterium]|nr:sterol desaturase family protein [Chitinophagaceae bacterium]